MKFVLDVVRDEVTPMVTGARQALVDRTGMNRAAAAGMLPLVQRNFVSLAGSNRNSFGAPSTFWNLMLSGTRAGVDDEGGYVATPQPVALRYFGGTVTPKVAKNLAIPANAQAYGKSPKDFSDLRFVMFGPGGAKALVQATQQAIKYRRVKGQTRVQRGPVLGGQVFFWLVPSATIRPDPRVLPDPLAMVTAGQNAVASFIDLRSRRRS